MQTHPPQLGPDGEFNADLPVGAVSASPEAKAKNEQNGTSGCIDKTLNIIIGVALIPVILLIMPKIDHGHREVLELLPCDLSATENYSNDWFEDVTVRKDEPRELYAFDTDDRRVCHLEQLFQYTNGAYGEITSPDKRYELFWAWFGSSSRSPNLLIFDTQLEQLSKISEDGNVRGNIVTWSPDSHHLIYAARFDGSAIVQMVDLYTFEQTELVDVDYSTAGHMFLSQAIWTSNHSVIVQIDKSWEGCPSQTDFYQINIETLEYERVVDGLCGVGNENIEATTITWDQMKYESNWIDKEKVASCTANLNTREITCEPAPTDAE